MSVEIQVYDIHTELLLEDLKKQFQTDHSYSYAKTFGMAIKLSPTPVHTEIRNILQKANYRVVAPQSNLIVAVNETSHLQIFVVHRLKYTSITFLVWATSVEGYNKIHRSFQELFKEYLATGPICGMRWAFHSGSGLNEIFLEELIEETIHDEAYPSLTKKWGSVNNFIDDFYNSESSILILQGKPGTGKSRLIRHLLAQFVTKSEQVLLSGNEDRSSYKSTVLYTSDQKLFESDELFARFITADEKVFIVEDADHVLQPRSGGNNNVHRFLTISDGIFRAVGKKLIFTTNLVNIGDIDDALTRPGRCFAHEQFKSLSSHEAQALLQKLGSSLITEEKSYTVADVYAFIAQHK